MPLFPGEMKGHRKKARTRAGRLAFPRERLPGPRLAWLAQRAATTAGSPFPHRDARRSARRSALPPASDIGRSAGRPPGHLTSGMSFPQLLPARPRSGPGPVLSLRSDHLPWPGPASFPLQVSQPPPKSGGQKAPGVRCSGVGGGVCCQVAPFSPVSRHFPQQPTLVWGAGPSFSACQMRI